MSVDSNVSSLVSFSSLFCTKTAPHHLSPSSELDELLCLDHTTVIFDNLSVNKSLSLGC